MGSDTNVELSSRGADARVAEAINRVLESERTAEAAIAECERSCAELLERAREQRRTMLERAQARIVALHTRAAQALERRCAALVEQRTRAAATTAAQLSDPQHRISALERLAARLTTADSKRDDRGA